VAQSLAPELIASIVGGYNGDPFAVLGPHVTTLDAAPAVAIRTFLPWAEHVQVARDDTLYDMELVHPEGLFEAVIPSDSTFSYSLRATNRQGYAADLLDPYSFGPLLTDFDLHLISQGTHYRTYEKLGAHIRDVGGVRGVHFAVWAPNARRVSVIGNFNNWDGRVHPMRFHPGPGIWEIFIPNLGAGEAYKYQIRTRTHGMIAEKADPYGFYAEYRPNTSSIVADIDHYQWHDADWLADRSNRQALSSPISIYEVHLGSWKRIPGGGRPTTADRSVTEAGGWLDYRQLAHELVDYVKHMGFTHIELMPVSEHPFDGSWGYQTIGYYAVTSRYGTPEDFQYFVDHCHRNDIGVLLDWVPAHFPRDAHGLAFFDGTHLYEHADPRLGSHPDWGTLIFNYGRNEVRNFLLSNALFWLDKYHIDGLRVDAVASMLYLNFSRPEGSWIPNRYGGTENLEAIDFLKRFNELTHLEHPDVLTMAEDSTDWPMVTRPTFLGGLGFDLKWNMGWMNDMLKYMKYDPIYRRYHHNMITFSLIYAFNENFLLPLSHDEVVHLKKSLLNKMPGDSWQQFAGLRALLGYQFTHPGKKLLFMGTEFGQRNEWTEQKSLDWHELEYESHRGVHNFAHDLINLYKSEPALWQVDNSWEGFEWLAANDNENSIIAFVRKAAPTVDSGPPTENALANPPSTVHRPPSTVNEEIVVICNFTPVARTDYRVPVPHAGYYREILNSDAGEYWGSNVGNAGGVWASEDHWADSGYALNLTVPPLGVLLLKAGPGPMPVAQEEIEATNENEPEQDATPNVSVQS
jgi:1,4-alpha-glucan branching enzyme